MPGWRPRFRGRKNPQLVAQQALVAMRQQLSLLEGRKKYLNTRMGEEWKKAKANVIDNKPVALAALRRRKQCEIEIEWLARAQIALEAQVAAVEIGASRHKSQAIDQPSGAGIHRKPPRSLLSRVRKKAKRPVVL
ncbi:ESCRT-III subunit protein snf7 [Tulasnella sp. JGI-2019a]|nr:ESCRT-III subunit protein snf7 [Tulasnella sp. JGI-2019a]